MLACICNQTCLHGNINEYGNGNMLYIGMYTYAIRHAMFMPNIVYVRERACERVCVCGRICVCVCVTLLGVLLPFSWVLVQQSGLCVSERWCQLGCWNPPQRPRFPLEVARPPGIDR